MVLVGICPKCGSNLHDKRKYTSTAKPAFILCKKCDVFYSTNDPKLTGDKEKRIR